MRCRCSHAIITESLTPSQHCDLKYDHFTAVYVTRWSRHFIPLQLIESDIPAHQDQLDDIMAEVRKFREARHFPIK